MKSKGFTLIEIMTAVSVFLVVMTISMGAILGVFDANRKSESLKTVMDNLNFSLETMSKEMRFGTEYHCETDPQTPPPFTGTGPKNCTAGGALVSFLSSDNVTQISYRQNGNAIEKMVETNMPDPSGFNFSPVWIAVTAPEITIQSTNFFVTGANPSPGDHLQPKVLIKVKGNAGSKSNTRTDFTLQTTVSQRLLDT